MHFTLEDSVKKLFTSQYIHNRSHLGLKKICQAISVFIDINVDPQFSVIRISQTVVYLPPFCGTAYKNVPQ